jgi:hypothetical protein
MKYTLEIISSKNVEKYCRKPKAGQDYQEVPEGKEIN